MQTMYMQHIVCHNRRRTVCMPLRIHPEMLLHAAASAVPTCLYMQRGGFVHI